MVIFKRASHLKTRLKMGSMGISSSQTFPTHAGFGENHVILFYFFAVLMCFLQISLENFCIGWTSLSHLLKCSGTKKVFEMKKSLETQLCTRKRLSMRDDQI